MTDDDTTTESIDDRPSWVQGLFYESLATQVEEGYFDDD